MDQTVGPSKGYHAFSLIPVAIRPNSRMISRKRFSISAEVLIGKSSSTRKGLQLGMPAGHDERRREGMGRPFFKNAERRVGGLGIVQFPERVNQEDVEDIPAHGPLPLGRCRHEVFGQSGRRGAGSERAMSREFPTRRVPERGDQRGPPDPLLQVRDPLQWSARSGSDAGQQLRHERCRPVPYSEFAV